MGIIVGDGVYNLLKVVIRHRARQTPPAAPEEETLDFDDKRRTEIFLKEEIPSAISVVAYTILTAVSVATVPIVISQIKWYHVAVICLIAPLVAFANSYGMGITDCSMAATYGKVAVLAVCSWAGRADGGVITGLAACGLVIAVASTAADLAQGFKTAYMTLASPRSVLVGQLLGTAMGCVIAPCVFGLFYKLHHVGMPGTEYSLQIAGTYRDIAILGVQGIGSLPTHCLQLSVGFFVAAVIINMVRDLVGPKTARFVPLPMAIGIAASIGPFFAIAMCIGSSVKFAWEHVDNASARELVSYVASGLLCGDAAWGIPQSILALAGLKPPICIKFLSRSTNEKVDTFLTPSLS